MSQGIKLIVYPVQDLAAAKTFYSTLLDTEPYADAPYYVGFRAGDLEVGLDPHGHKKGVAGPISYTEVSDIRKSLQLVVDAGGQLQQDVQDVGGGKLIALVKDADGNVLGLMQSP
jgi:predicted enzyme related to lactoylglutathione lyase